MSCTIYHDVFGGWRWECHIGGTVRDSQHSYDTREECVHAAERAVSKLVGLGSIPMDETQRMQQLSCSRSVMCVQPKHELHDLFQCALQDCEVVLVVNAFEALRRFNISSFDSYVIEYWLPDWSGIQLCREIRRTDPHVPICFYVSAAKEEQRKRALRAGANSYICASAGFQALRQELQTRLQFAEARSTQARAVEELVIHEELERRRQLAVSAPEAAKNLTPIATERAAKVKARKAFIEAGGTAAYFERSWREMFNTTTENLRKKDAESAVIGNL